MSAFCEEGTGGFGVGDGAGGLGGCGICMAEGARGGIGGFGGTGIAGAGGVIGWAAAIGAPVIWLILRGAAGAVLNAAGVGGVGGGATGFGIGLFIPLAVPNSNTAGRIGACAALLPPRFMSAPPCGFASVKPAFFSGGLKAVSSCSITGAGSGIAGFGAGPGFGVGMDAVGAGIGFAGVGIGTGFGVGIVAEVGVCAGAGVVVLIADTGIFDQPTSERMVGLGATGAGIISFGILEESITNCLAGGIWNLSNRSISIPYPEQSFFIGAKIFFFISSVICVALFFSNPSSEANSPLKYSGRRSLIWILCINFAIIEADPPGRTKRPSSPSIMLIAASEPSHVLMAPGTLESLL